MSWQGYGRQSPCPHFMYCPPQLLSEAEHNFEKPQDILSPGRDLTVVILNKNSPMHRPPLTPRQYSWYSFLLEAESTSGPRSYGLCKWNIPMTPSGIETATFWLVAQCFNQLNLRIRLTDIYKVSEYNRRQNCLLMYRTRLLSEL